jgi:endonuclease/exonuclease/phosphatase family metal-dependent hydrolase
MLNGAPGPLIVAGDFNMNQHHRWYRKLKDQGLDNCHEERGRGNATTWPKNRKLRPIRIDRSFTARASFAFRSAKARARAATTGR